MPKEKRKYQGKIYVVDTDKGTFEEEKPAISVSPEAKIGPASNSTIGDTISNFTGIKPNSEADARGLGGQVAEGLTNFGVNMLPTAFSMAGGMVAGVPGYIAGQLAGSGLKTGIKGSDSPVTDTLYEAGVNSGLDALNFGVGKTIGAGVPPLNRLFKAKATKGLKSTAVNPFKVALGEAFLPEEMAVSPSTLNYMINAGMDHPPITVLGGERSIAGQMGNILNPQLQKKILDKQAGSFKQILDTEIFARGGGLTPQQNAKVVKGQLAQGYDQRQKLIGKTFDAVRDGAPEVSYDNVREVTSPIAGADGRPVTTLVNEPYKIKGPVTASNTGNFVDSLIPQIVDNYKLPSTEGLLPYMTEDQRQTMQLLQRFAGAKDGKPIPLEVALQLKKITGQRGYAHSLPLGVDEAVMQKVNALLDQDIRASFDQYAPDVAKNLTQKYNRGNALATKQGEIFRDDKTVANLMTTPRMGVEEMRTILKDPNLIRSTIRGSKNGQTTRAALSSEYLDSIFEKTQSPKILNEFLSRDNLATNQALFTQPEQARLRKTFQALSETNTQVPSFGQANLALREGSAGLQVSKGVLESLFEGKISPALGAGGRVVGGVLGLKYLTRAVLQNPDVAMAAIQLRNMTTKSPGYSKAIKALKLGLKGAEIGIIDSGTGERLDTVRID
jgi:hypothetical protein